MLVYDRSTYLISAIRVDRDLFSIIHKLIHIEIKPKTGNVKHGIHMYISTRGDGGYVDVDWI